MRTKDLRQIMSEGTLLEPLKWYKGREKAYGAMYEARCVVEYCNMQLYFEMWHHHNSEQCMTEDEVLSHIELKGLRVEGKYYDLGWHARLFAGEFWLHKAGWFEPVVQDGRRVCNPLDSHPLVCFSHEVETVTEEIRKELLDLGFVHVRELSIS